MDATIVMRLPDGSTSVLGHGDLIGRLETAALHLSDPRISEAHAMVSLRGASLKLVGLRGRIIVDGFALRDVELVPGLVVHLAPDFALTVEDVTLPELILGLEVAGHGVRMMTGVCSLVGGTLRNGYSPEAQAWFWPEGADLVVRRLGHHDEVLGPGDTLELDQTRVVARSIAMDRGRSFATTAPGLVPESARPMTLIARFTSVHITRADSRTLVIGGLAARIVSELVLSAVPMPWASLAREIWPQEASDMELRARWDVTLSRLRKKLAAAGVRADLVRSDGHGNIELCLAPGDVVRDDT